MLSETKQTPVVEGRVELKTFKSEAMNPYILVYFILQLDFFQHCGLKKSSKTPKAMTLRTTLRALLLGVRQPFEEPRNLMSWSR